MILNSIKSIQNIDPILVESLLEGYNSIFESSNDKYKYDALSSLINELSPALDEAMKYISEGNNYKSIAAIKNNEMYIIDSNSNLQKLNLPEDLIKHLSLKFINLSTQKSNSQAQYKNNNIELFIDLKLHDEMKLEVSDWEWDYENIYKKEMLKTLFHELVHAYDVNTFKFNYDNDYIKRPQEVNAWLLHLVKGAINKGESFQEFLHSDSQLSGVRIWDWLQNFNEIERKSIIKRLYDMWNHID